jgi:anti-sigma-K factor RskA
MRCQFAYDDAGYVLGALPPDERREFVAHLPTCPDCRTSVRDLAGLPGLLARVEPQDVLSLDAPPEAAPRTLLPRLLAIAQADQLRARRRRTMTFALAACLIVVLAIAMPLAYVGMKGRNAAPGPAAVVTTLAMQPVKAGTPVQAAVGLSETRWGTDITLRCQYRNGEYATKQTYALYAVPRSGPAEPLGSWSVAPGDQVKITAPTKLHRSELAALEIRRADGEPILRTTL